MAAPEKAAAAMPRYGLPVTAAAANPVDAPINMMPSRPRLTTPDRSPTISPSVA
jgi:hypothetical protein